MASLIDSISKFGSGYNISSLTYPLDMSNPEEYGDNFVTFFINVQQESKFAKSKTIVQDAVRSMLTPNRIAEAGLLQGMNSILGALGLDNTDISEIQKQNGLLDESSKTTAKDAKTAVDGAQANNVKDVTKTTKRISDAIVLHMPTALSIRYSVSYDEVDLTKLAFGLGLLDSGSSLFGTASAGAEARLLNKNDKLKALLRTTTNPKTELIFKSVDLRSFQFSYRFAPRNEKEAQNVLNIIKTFKVHMYPEYKDKQGFLYLFPSEFDITYFAGGSVNKSIHGHTSCVLTGMTTDYTPNGVFTTLEDGTPPQINLTLEFKELTTLDRDSIDKYNL